MFCIVDLYIQIFIYCLFVSLGLVLTQFTHASSRYSNCGFFTLAVVVFLKWKDKLNDSQKYLSVIFVLNKSRGLKNPDLLTSNLWASFMPFQYLCLSSIWHMPLHHWVCSGNSCCFSWLLTLCSEVRIKHNKLPYVTIRDQTALLCGTAVLFHLFQSRHDVLWEWSELSVSWDYCESTSCDQPTAGEELRFSLFGFLSI